MGVDTINTNLNGYKKDIEERGLCNKIVKNERKVAAKEVTKDLQAGITLLGSGCESQLVGLTEVGPPSWVDSLDKSHSLFHAAGVVFCATCGHLVTSNRKCELRKGCHPPAKGSLQRIANLSAGKHCSLGSEWKSKGIWPDGRPAKAIVPMCKVFR